MLSLIRMAILNLLTLRFSKVSYSLALKLEHTQIVALLATLLPEVTPNTTEGWTSSKADIWSGSGILLSELFSG